MALDVSFSSLTTCAVFVCFAGVVFQAFNQSRSLSELTVIAGELGRLEHDPEANRRIVGGKVRVAVGYGSCTDLYIDSYDFLKERKDAGGDGMVGREFQESAAITNEEDLRHSFGHYFEQGAAAE